MIARACLIILSLFTVARAEYDDNILWRYSFTSCNIGYSISPDKICQKNYNAIFLHTNPYQLSDLNWDYVSGKTGFGKWGVSGSFRSYRLVDLYNDIKVSLCAAYGINQDLYVSVETSFGHEKFGGMADYDRADMNIHALYLVRSLSIHGGVNHISLKKPYRFHNKIAQPFVVCNLLIRGNSNLLVGYKQIEPVRGRWLFSQSLSISSNLSLGLGYLTYPNLLQCGLDLRWENITFSIIYQGMDKLDDTIIWGLSTGK